MHNFEINSIDDLVANASFQHWILSGDEGEGAFWSRWIGENPEKLEWIATARSVIQVLAANSVELSSDEVDTAAAAIQQKILEKDYHSATDDDSVTGSTGFRHSLTVRSKWVAAASLLLAIIAGTLIIKQIGINRYPDSYSTFLHKAAKKGTTYHNNSPTPLLIHLPDNSEVKLETGGNLVYIEDGTPTSREVFLSGNAFFNVANDPSHPFIVYTPNIVARVLGTSFRVKAIPDEIITSITVCSGKISVYKTAGFTNQKSVGGLLLTPNQKIEYDIAKEQISKALVDTPQVTKKDTADFNFEAAPVIKILKRMEDVYSIPIVYDEHILSTCSITAVLDDESFYGKLKAICKIIDATYEIIDGTIVISAKGCK